MDRLLNPYAKLMERMKKYCPEICAEVEAKKQLAHVIYEVKILRASPEFYERTSSMTPDEFMIFLLNPESISTPFGGVIGPRGIVEFTIAENEGPPVKKENDYWSQMRFRYIDKGDYPSVKLLLKNSRKARKNMMVPPVDYKFKELAMQREGSRV